MHQASMIRASSPAAGEPGPHLNQSLKYAYKKCWVKYNPVLGKYWTVHMLGCFQLTVGLNV